MIYKATEDLHRDVQETQYSNSLLGDDAFRFENNTKTIKSFRLPTQTTTIPLRKFTEFYGGFEFHGPSIELVPATTGNPDPQALGTWAGQV